MKPGFAVLPLEVWADVSEHPLITREVLAQIADNNGDPNFTNKLQKLLHGCGKHTLHYLKITSRNKKKSNIPERQASLKVTSDYGEAFTDDYKKCEFPETEMPDNIKTFKQLQIRFLDDQVLAFLDRIKSLFNNVDLVMVSTKSEENIHTILAHLLPLLGSIRGIYFDLNDGMKMESFEQRFPETLALAKELWLYKFDTRPAYIPIPALLNWLTAPQNFDVDGPRFLFVNVNTFFAFVDAVRKHFLAATTQSAAFVIFLVLHFKRHFRADEFTVENATTKEQLTVRNECYKQYVNYVEIVRHPTGADAKMRDWINGRAYFNNNCFYRDEKHKEILISNPRIGRITKKAKALDQGEIGTADDDEHEAGQSTSAKK